MGQRDGPHSRATAPFVQRLRVPPLARERRALDPPTPPDVASPSDEPGIFVLPVRALTGRRQAAA